MQIWYHINTPRRKFVIQKEIEFVAHQLSKITDNVRYNYPKEYYENSPQHGFVSRDLDLFFEEAKKYVSACEYESDPDVYFTLNVFDYESYKTVFNLLKYFDYIIEDDDEKNYTFDEENGLYEFYVVVDAFNVHSFISSKKQGEFSLVQLSRIIDSPINFFYANNNGLQVVKPVNDSFVVKNGKVEMNGTFEFNELNTLSDVFAFNSQLSRFISLFPSLESALESNISLSGTSSN